MSKILFGENGHTDDNRQPDTKNDNRMNQNIFQGRTETSSENAKFPSWDIVPPNQFINPRIKPQ